MSEVMQICYGGIPQLEPLIRKQEAREAAKPKFQLPTLPVFPASRIFDCIKSDDEHYGNYVTRDNHDIEVVVEVNGWEEPCDVTNDPGGPNFGNAWTLDGKPINLTPEESERLAEDWRKMMEARAEREARENAHGAEY